MTSLKALVAGVAFAAGGCAVKPIPLTDAEHQQRAQVDYLKLFAGQEVLPGVLTISDSIARAIKYNQEYRQRLMEQAVALGQTQLASYDLLPKLTASAGYSTRDNDAFGFGFGENGKVSANPSASSERNIRTSNIDFAWNVLDFGLSYVRAKQLADQSLIAEEQRRKSLQNLVQDVRQAWWRAQFANQLLPQISELLVEIQATAARARLIESRRLLPPLQIVAYRRSLLDLEQQMAAKIEELSQAQIEFATLLNLPPGSQYKLPVVNDDTDLETPDLTANIDALETMALENRPELRQEQYRGRLTDREWQKQILSLLPNFGLDLSPNYTSNKYVLNNQWTTAGMNFSFGLLKLFSLPAARSANQAQKDADEVRRLAIAAGVVGQTRIAAVRYRTLIDEFAVWDAAVRDDARIVEYLSASRESGLETQLEVIRAKGRAMISKVQRDLVYANVQGSIGRLYNSIGLDALPREVASQDTKALASALKSKIDQWEKANFAEKPQPDLAPITFARMELPSAGLEPFESAMNRVLRLSKVAVIPDKNTEFKLFVTLKLEATQSGSQSQPAVLNLRLTNGDGAVVASGEQKTMLVAPVGREQWDALGESAAYRMIDPLLKALKRNPGSTQQGARDAVGEPQLASTTPKLKP